MGEVVILALDLSLTCTGATILRRDGLMNLWTISTRPGPLGARLRFIYNEIQDVIRLHPVELLVIEGPSYGSKQGLLSAGEVRATFELAVWHYQLPVLEVPPGTLKQYATGRGSAPKAEVVAEAIRRLGYSGHDDNVADAMWLAQIGAAILGWDCAVKVPASHMKGGYAKLTKSVAAA